MSSANGRGHLYIAPMDEAKDFCDFDFDNIKELNGSTGSYFDEDGSVQKKDKGGIEGDCMFIIKTIIILPVQIYTAGVVQECMCLNQKIYSAITN